MTPVVSASVVPVSPSPNKDPAAKSNSPVAESTTAAIPQESHQEKEERLRYEESLASRYFLKEGGISWDVEVHQVIPSRPGVMMTKPGDKAATGTPGKSSRKSLEEDTPQTCIPITPHTPVPSPATPGAPVPPSPSFKGGKGVKGGKGMKTKYRCKLCGQPKQGHRCPFGRKSLVRSIGTMVYPAVNAFVSHEPGALAPALSEMNNFTHLLSRDDSSSRMDGSTVAGSGYYPASGVGGPRTAYGRAHPYAPPPLHGRRHPGPPYRILSQEASHPRGRGPPDTPGGLSTMSSCDLHSPGSAAPVPAGRRPLMGGGRGPLSPGSAALCPPPPPRPPPAPAGAIPSDVLFRDTMELQQEQYRTVGAVRSSPGGGSNDGGGEAPPPPAVLSPNAYRYPPVPTPFVQRKELGDALFALSREVPDLADACAAVLRDARESDLWDQAVAELTTQVLVVLKCEENDTTLEGLHRHLLTLGIAC